MPTIQRADHAPDRFRLSVVADEDRPVLELFGELDLGSVPALERELDALTAPGRTVAST